GLSSRAIASGLGVLLLVACSTGGSTQQSASSTDVTQWVAWGGQELTAYRDVLKPFESKTGIKVHVTTNRESTTAIANGIEAGNQVYTDWINGKKKWTSPEIKLGYQTFLKEVSAANVYGGPNTALSTNFGKAGDPLFKSPAGCLFLEQATFIANFFTQNTPGL